jgi:hypothetical protein
MTAEQTRRVVEAIAETERQLARASRYQEKFQDKDLITFYQAHLAKLRGMFVIAA